MYLAPCSTLSTNPTSSTNPSKIITLVLNFKKLILILNNLKMEVRHV